MILLRKWRILRLFEEFYRRLWFGLVGVLGWAALVGGMKTLLDVYFMT
jgi:hypothetical protein